MKFKDRLRELRKRSGLTQDELADKLNISRSTIAMYESGKREADFDTLFSIAEFFNESVGYLLGEASKVSLRIMHAIKNSGLSYGELSDMTKINKTTLHYYATEDASKCPIEQIAAIANATGVSVNFLLGFDNDKYPSPDITDDYITFPVIGEIAAGYNNIILEDWDGERIDIPKSYLSGHSKDDFFVLRVKGNSMYPLYHEGDKVLIFKQTTLNRSGEIGAILYDDDCATLKKVEYVTGEDWMLLLPLNPEYPPERIEGERLEHCRVIGIPRLLIREIN